MSIADLVALIAVGLFAGLTGGMLGIGGSIVMIPAMTEVLGPNQHLYQAAAMIVNFFVVVPAVYHHRQAKAVDGATVARILPLALVSVVAGVALSELTIFAGAGEAYLRGIFGLFLLSVCVYDLYRLLHPRSGVPAENGGPRKGWGFAAAVGLPCGLVAGLLGVGGGILAVPLQRRFLNVPIRIAIANSATLIIATSLIGASFKNYAYITQHGNSLQSLLLAAVLIPTAIIGSLVGSRLTHLLPLRIVKTAFFVLMAVAAVRLMYKAVRDAPGSVLPPTPAVAQFLPPSPDRTPSTGLWWSGRAQLSQRPAPIRPMATRKVVVAGSQPVSVGPRDGPEGNRTTIRRIRIMLYGKSCINGSRRPSRVLTIVALSAGIITQCGCLPTGQEFRDVAGPAVEEGLGMVVDGLLDGLFAVIDPDETDSDGGS